MAKSEEPIVIYEEEFYAHWATADKLAKEREPISWELIEQICDTTPTCWAEWVTWKLGYVDEASDFLISSDCWSGKEGQEYDYCGRHLKLKDFNAAMALAEKQRTRSGDAL
jgi:hypothetical protein